MSKSWVIGDWAAEAERAEEEEKARAAAADSAPPEAFPSLSESVVAKPRKKKQQQTFTISEFTFGKSVSHGSRTRAISDSRGLTTQEMMMLPTGPRDRSGEEALHGGLGGAFPDYRGGGDHRGGPDRFVQERDRSTGYSGGYEREREASGFLRDRDRDEPSRADDSHDWSSSKRAFFPQGGGYDVERRGSHDGVERRGSRQANADLPPSRADEVENWGLVKKSLPLVDARPSRRNDDTRQQFRADGGDNWASSKKAISPPVVEIVRGQSRADEAANWLSSKRVPAERRDLQPQETNADAPSHWGRPMQQQAPENSQRRPVVLAPRSHPRSPSPPPGHMNADVSNALPPLGPKLKPNPFGFARPREEVLANRGPDVPRVENEPGAKERDSRPSSSHSSRPGTPEVSVEPVVKPRLKVNPFGNAKPREVLLQERGKDWRKIDFELEHRGVDRPETQEEMALKEEIRILTELSKQEVEANAQRINGDVLEPYVDLDAKRHSIIEELHIKEKELQRLVMALDDNVRFSQKVVERPGSHSGRSDIGRSSEFSERSGSRPGSRPGSRSGRSDTGSNHDPSERLGSVPGRRNLDASDRMHSLSGYGGGRSNDVGERPWSRFGQVEGTRNQEAVERMGPWSGHNENRSFESLQRPRWRSAAALPTEVGGGADYSQQASGPDIWIRANEGSHNRQMNWREQERVNERAGMRRF